MKSKLLADYHIGFNDPTAALTLDDISEFISEHGIIRMIITDSDGVLGVGKKWTNFMGRLFIPLNRSKPDKQNQNPVEHAIQNLKAGLIKIRNACGVGVLAYHWEVMYTV